MEKYQLMLKEQTKTKLDGWYRDQSEIHNADVYRLLHSIKGTSRMVGLPEWHDVAQLLLDQLKEDGTELWQIEKLKHFLSPLIDLVKNKTGNLQMEPDVFVPVQSEQKLSAQEHEPSSLVVLFDDQLEIIQMVKSHLEAVGIQVMATPNPQRAMELFYSMTPDCVILNVVLPNQSGYEIVKEIQEQCEKSLVPTVLVSFNNNKETRMMCYESGADEFIPFPFDPDEFSVRVLKQIRRRKKMIRMLMLDELTNTFNINYFYREIDRVKEECLQRNLPLSIALVDIDQFRKINEQFGYSEGDRLLTKLTSHFQSKVKLDYLFVRDRYDRFYICFKGLTAQESRQELLHLLQSTSKLRFQTDAGDYFITCSAGVADWNKDISLNECLRRSTQALHAAKAEGGNLAVAFNETALLQSVENKLFVAIIDDDPLIRNMLSKRLSDLDIEDIEIRTFDDGESFFEDKWSQYEGKFMFIVDRLMPRMNGMEVVARLRSEFGNSRHSILMLTVVGEEYSIAEALKAGVDDYMTKPFGLKELEARVFKLIRGIRK